MSGIGGQAEEEVPSVKFPLLAPAPRHPQGRVRPHRLQELEDPTNPSLRILSDFIKPHPTPTPIKSVTRSMIPACWVGEYIPSLLERNFYCLHPGHPTGGHPHTSGRPESVVV
jgi:hypothetical protein